MNKPASKEKAEEKLLEMWRAYDGATGREKAAAFFKLAEHAIEYAENGVIPKDVAAYRICHCGLSLRSGEFEGFEQIFDEACDLELGKDYVKDFNERWQNLKILIRKAQTGDPI